MSGKKIAKQLSNVVLMQAAGYAVGEVFREYGPKIKKKLGIGQEAEETPKEVAPEPKPSRVNSLINEAKAGLERKKNGEEDPVPAKYVEDEGEEDSEQKD